MSRFRSLLASASLSFLALIYLTASSSDLAFAQGQGQDQLKTKGQRKDQDPTQKKGRNQAKEKGKGQRGPKHIFAGSAPEHPFDVILARPTDRSITVSLLAYKPMEAFITYGQDKNAATSKTSLQKLQSDNPVVILLADLKPDTSYSYVLHTKSADATEFKAGDPLTFHTQRKPGSPFTFTVQADSHMDQGTQPAIYERTLANMNADRPDLFIDLGDTFMTDKYDDFKDSLPQYIAQRYYLGLVARSTPLFLVLGNHDGERMERNAGSPDSMPGWSNLHRKKYFPNPFPDGFYTGNQTEVQQLSKLEDYYAWEWGDALFVALDPFWNTSRGGRGNPDGNWTRTLGDEQFHWLERTLAASRSTFKFLFIHHLVGGVDESNRGGSEAAAMYEWGGKGADDMDEFHKNRPGWSMPIHQLLVKNKVSVVFHGHDHFFAKQDLDGVVYLLVPQPGHPSFDRLRPPVEYGYKQGDFLAPAGHIRVRVSPEKAEVDYVRSYDPRSESAERKSGDVSYSFKIMQ